MAVRERLSMVTLISSRAARVSARSVFGPAPQRTLLGKEGKTLTGFINWLEL